MANWMCAQLWILGMFMQSFISVMCIARGAIAQQLQDLGPHDDLRNFKRLQ